MGAKGSLSVLIPLALQLWLSPVFATESIRDVSDTRNKPAIRGGIVYHAYCTLCHGESADGKARASKLHAVPELDLSKGHEYIEKIIRHGGKAVGKNEAMPSWQEELSEEQINDVIAYISIVKSPASRGEIVFKSNCVLCHGTKGDGKGRASTLFNPPPSDLTKSDKNDEYKKAIITLGGQAMGRSEVMPPWNEQLTEQQISDAVAYLKTILIP